MEKLKTETVLIIKKRNIESFKNVILQHKGKFRKFKMGNRIYKFEMIKYLSSSHGFHNTDYYLIFNITG